MATIPYGTAGRNIALATPIAEFRLRSGEAGIDEPAELARRKQRDRWRSAISCQRARAVSGGWIAATGALSMVVMTAIAWANGAPLPAATGIVCIPGGLTMIWGLLRWYRARRALVQLLGWLAKGRERLGPLRYQARSGGWRFSRLPLHLRYVSCLLLLIVPMMAAVTLGIIGWDTPRGGPFGFLTILVSLGLPGLALGLALWPVASRRAPGSRIAHWRLPALPLRWRRLCCLMLVAGVPAVFLALWALFFLSVWRQGEADPPLTATLLWLGLMLIPCLVFGIGWWPRRNLSRPDSSALE